MTSQTASSDEEKLMANSNFREERSNRGLHPAALAALVAGGALAAYGVSRRYRQRKKGGGEPGRYSFIRTVTIDRPASELWAFWRNEENAPRFMQHVKTVRKTGERTSHWVMQTPGAPRIEWDSEIYEERPGELLAWRTVRGAWSQDGRLLFRPAPGNRGTEVRLEMEYEVPGGAIARALAMIVGDEPEQLGQVNLMRFKQWMEAGEIITVAGQPHGSRRAKGKLLQVLLREPEGVEIAGKISKKWQAAGERATSAAANLRDRWSRAARASSAVADVASSWKKTGTATGR
jgi:uncharacterized membrane protein